MLSNKSFLRATGDSLFMKLFAQTHLVHRKLDGPDLKIITHPLLLAADDTYFFISELHAHFSYGQSEMRLSDIA